MDVFFYKVFFEEAGELSPPSDLVRLLGKGRQGGSPGP